MSHLEYIRTVAAKTSSPCVAHHITFGGRCLNCGYDPQTAAGIASIRRLQAAGAKANQK